jgi:hypothetical protein
MNKTNAVFLAVLFSLMLVAVFNGREVAAESPTDVWAKTYGGIGDDYAGALVQTDDGGYALAGSTYSFGAGRGDFWLVKTDAAGNVQWNKTYGGTGNENAMTLIQTDDGGYALAGQTCSFGAGCWDFWLVKTDENGVVPEFPSMILPALLMIVTILAAALLRKGKQSTV